MLLQGVRRRRPAAALPASASLGFSSAALREARSAVYNASVYTKPRTQAAVWLHATACTFVGTWLSLVERTLGVGEVASSNLVVPTIKTPNTRCGFTRQATLPTLSVAYPSAIPGTLTSMPTFFHLSQRRGPRPRRFVCVLAAVALCGYAAAIRAQATRTPSAEPEVLQTPAGITEVGVLTDAEYRIDIPSNWNHGLVVFYHGYSERPFRYRLDSSIGIQAEPMLRRGFAVIQSGYSQTGWALQVAYSETEELRRYFIRKYGAPRETIAAGGSMGGALVMITLELNPKNTYAAGLDLCGAVGPSYIHLNRRFLWRAAFDYYFPGIMGPLDPVPANFEESDALRNRVVTAMKAKPDGAAAMRNLTGLHTDIEVARAVGYYTFVIADLQRKAGFNNLS